MNINITAEHGGSTKTVCTWAVDPDMKLTDNAAIDQAFDAIKAEIMLFMHMHNKISQNNS